MSEFFCATCAKYKPELQRIHRRSAHDICTKCYSARQEMKELSVNARIKNALIRETKLAQNKNAIKNQQEQAKAKIRQAIDDYNLNKEIEEINKQFVL